MSDSTELDFTSNDEVFAATGGAGTPTPEADPTSFAGGVTNIPNDPGFASSVGNAFTDLFRSLGQLGTDSIKWVGDFLNSSSSKSVTTADGKTVTLQGETLGQKLVPALLSGIGTAYVANESNKRADKALDIKEKEYAIEREAADRAQTKFEENKKAGEGLLSAYKQTAQTNLASVMNKNRQRKGLLSA